MSASPQIDYRCFEELITKLQKEGFTRFADKLDFLLHRVAWTTGSELIGELGLEISSFEPDALTASSTLKQQLDFCMAEVKKVWPRES